MADLPRKDGYYAGLRYLKEYGLNQAKRYAKEISDVKPNNVEEYQYVDGFLNAVADAM